MPGVAPVGLKFLIFGDDALVALDLADMLTDLGHVVVATVNQMDKAMTIAATAALDVAILDMTVAGQPTFALAKLLRSRRVRVIFASGNGRTGLTSSFRDAPMLTKPFFRQGLVDMMAKVFGDMGGRAA